MSEQEVNANTLVEAVLVDTANNFMESHGIEEPSPEMVLESILDLNKMVHVLNEYVGLNSNSLSLNEESGEPMIDDAVLENCGRFLVKMYEQAATQEEQTLLEETEKKKSE